MICAAVGCDNVVPRWNVRYCSRICQVKTMANARRKAPLRAVLELVKPEPEPDLSYRMRCHHCGTSYDGRKGPWIGLCSLTCVGAHVMGEAAEPRVARMASG